ncbi:hypothetical protein GPROT2_01677, partial [Gammaproteobacteria bacterium]
GFRIEPGEIETQLARHPAVREVAVLALPDERGELRLAAYATAAEGERLDVQALRRHAAAGLPEHLVPSAFVCVQRLPLTPSGKLDVKALPAPQFVAHGSYEPPQGDAETTLAAIWSEVLGVERVGRHDDFFSLGGHSLLAITVIERMRRAGLQADVRGLLSAPTPAALAASLGATSPPLDAVPPNGIPPGCTDITPQMLPLVTLAPEHIVQIVAGVPGGAANVQDIYPLAPLQEGILFHHLMARGEGDPYLTPVLFGFDSRERLDSFVQALQAVVARHDILRTAVLWDGLPAPVQVVWRQAPLSVEEVPCERGAADAAAQLRARFDPRHCRLDLRRAPLMRLAAMHDAANGRWLLLLQEHHLLGDHTTMEVVQQEVQAHLAGEQHLLPPPLPFRQFVAAARQRAADGGDDAFFREMLADVDQPTTPFGLADVHDGGIDAAEAAQPVDEQLGERLRAQARRLGVGVASLCHLAWALVLSRLAGRDDVVFGTVLLGRMGAGDDSQRALGMFINTLPLRVRLNDVSAQEAAQRTHALLMQLLQHEHASLALAQRCSGVAAPAPLFTALLNYRHNAAPPDVDHPAPQAPDGVAFLGGEERTNYPLTMSVDDFGERYLLTAQAQAPVDPARVCGFMHTALQRLADALERAPAQPLAGIDLLPASERAQLLVHWNATEEAFAHDRCAHQLIEAQAARQPQAIALTGPGERVSYGELDRRATALARELKALGVRPDSRVAVC